MEKTFSGFEGTLILAPGERGLQARVLLDEDNIGIETADGQHEEWSREQLTIERHDTRTMELNLGEIRIFFEAESPLEFEERLTAYVSEPNPEATIAPAPTQAWLSL